jgi:hypothetical protein
MKTKRNFNKGLVAAFILSTILSFTACSSDSDVIANDTASAIENAQNNNNSTNNTFNLKLRALNQGRDITAMGYMSIAKLFVFGSDNEYIKTVEVAGSDITNIRTISINVPNEDQITVIGWGGVTGDGVQVPNAQVISDLTLSLKQNNGVASLPSDLFYGQININKNQTKSEDIATLYVERKVSQLQLQATGLAKKLGTTEGDFYFIVKQTGNAFDYEGHVIGDETSYIIPASVGATGTLYTEQTPIISGSDVEIELYRDDVMVFSTKNSKNSDYVATQTGKLMFMNIDLSKASYYVSAVAWGSVVVTATV